MQHQGTKYLETDRLILRPYTVEDAQAMYDHWAKDPDVTKYLTWPPHESAEATRMLLENWTANYEQPDYYQWAIELKEIGSPIGGISVVECREIVDEAVIGYCLGKNWWGKGLMPEAAKAVVSFLFEEVGCNRISATHDTNNPNSGRVMQKIGMQYEGTHRKSGKNNQGIVDEAVYAILREDYFSVK